MPALQDDLAVGVERLRHYRANPVDFFVDVLGVDRESVWTPMLQIANSVRDNRRTAVAGCHSSSKTFTAACLAWWWVLCWQPAKVITTAPGARQVGSVLWSEIHARHDAAPVPLGGRLLQSEWQSGEADTFMIGFATKEDTGAGGATRMQGFKSPNLLVIFDEAVQIASGIWQAVPGIITFEHNRWLAISNPTDPASEFARCWRTGSAWSTVNISAFDSPNLLTGERTRPHLPTREWIEEQRREYGEGSQGWDARVLGQFPSTTTNTLISFGDLARAFGREPGDARAEPVSIGLDVARQGDDFSSLFVVRGSTILHHEWWQGEYIDGTPALVHAAGRVRENAERFGIFKEHAYRISVDDTGLGGGVTDMLRATGYKVRAVNFGANAVDQDRFHDNRIELWSNLADWIRDEACLSDLPPEWTRHLEADLPGVVKLYQPDERWALEPKKVTKKRIGHSPDHGDALALALAWKARIHPLPWMRPKPPEDGPRNPRIAPPMETKRTKERRRAKAGMYDRGGEVGGIFGS